MTAASGERRTHSQHNTTHTKQFLSFQFFLWVGPRLQPLPALGFGGKHSTSLILFPQLKKGGTHTQGNKLF